MNFNYSKSPEYKLNSSLGKELINLYGIRVKILITEKINTDTTVFGDFSHMKSDSEKIFDLSVLPEDSDGWEDGGINLSPFGGFNNDNISLFVHNDYIKQILKINEVVGNLVIFPNNKLMEITHVDPLVPGLNNLFTFDDVKSILKLTCKPYGRKIINELEPDDLMYHGKNEAIYNERDFESMEKYLEELMETTDNLTEETEIMESNDTVKKNDNTPDEIVKKPTIDNTEDSVWGKF